MKEIIYIELLPAFGSARISYKNESIYAERDKNYPENVYNAVKELAKKYNLKEYEKKELR